MKKYGKYEKRPEAAPVKQPKVKNMLLQTYFTSLLCLVLCVTMFMGTSYAWFTSEVNNTGNEIYIGTLDVGLFAGDNGEKDLSKAENKLFDSDIRWEPGYTALETIKVVNEGDLTFKYELNFTDGSLTKNGQPLENLEEVAQFFDVWVYSYRKNNDVEPTDNSYESIKNGGKWVNAGTLEELLGGKTVLEGIMVTVRDDNENTAILAGTSDGVGTVDTYTIALHMNESATEAVMGCKINLNVKLVAYQRSGENSESDAFGPTYDSFAELSKIVQKQVKFNEYSAGTINCVGLGDDVSSITLDAAYQFQPGISYEEVQENDPQFRYWHVDFVVSADSSVPADSVALAGYYKLYCDSKTDGAWVALTSPDEIEAGQEIRLIETMGEGSISVNYEEICNFGNDGTGFLCGILDILDDNGDSQNAGTTITVELRLYETEEPSDENGNSHNIETGRYIVVGSYSYTFPNAEQSG